MEQQQQSQLEHHHPQVNDAAEGGNQHNHQIKNDDDSHPTTSFAGTVTASSSTATTTCFTITLDDDKKTNVSYVMRGLQDDKEVHEWAKFCAMVFSYKSNPPPPSYFERHYFHDPYRSDASLIRVILMLTLSNNNDTSTTVSGATTTTTLTAAASSDPTSLSSLLLVSSCRIFPRMISIGRIIIHPNNSNPTVGSNSLTTIATTTTVQDGTYGLLYAGGIGEVCTDDRHRRRGLSKVLLQDAIRIMTTMNPHNKSHHHPTTTTTTNMQVSLLHAAPNFFPVYQSAGYTCSLSEWSVISFDWNKLVDHANNNNKRRTMTTTTTTTSMMIRLANFPQDTERLHAIHQIYSEQRFAGCIIRSIEYWNEYIQHELDGSLWVLLQDNHQDEELRQQQQQQRECPPASSFIIVAWISIRNRGGNRFQVRDFGCDETIITTSKAFTILITKAISHILVKSNNNDDDDETNDSPNPGCYSDENTGGTTTTLLDLHLPTFLVTQIQMESATTSSSAATGDDNDIINNLDWIINVVSENDHGWMYKPLLGDDDQIMATLLSPDRPHLIWPADSF